MGLRGQDFTKTSHTKPYAAIALSRPELSQAGRTVLVTGGTAGIGYAIARGFLRAGAARVIILGRNAERAAASAESLRQEAREANPEATGAEVVGLAVDMADAAAIEKLWKRFGGGDGKEKDKIVVDVLVLNAASFSPPKTIMELGVNGLWRDFEVNVRAQVDMAERFYKQTGKPADRPLVCSIHLVTLCPITTFIVPPSRQLLLYWHPYLPMGSLLAGVSSVIE